MGIDKKEYLEVIEALMMMVDQFFYEGEDELLYHSFMAAEECAISALIKAGFAEQAEYGDEYRLLWDKLSSEKGV